MQILDSNATKRTLPRVKSPAQLAEPLSRRLNAYTLAAAAAGVGVLGGAMPAEAAPVCKQLSVDLRLVSTFPLNPAGQAAAPFNVAQTASSYFFSTTGVSQFVWWNRGFFVPNSGGAKVLLGAKDLPADVALGAVIGPGGPFGKPASYGMLFTYGVGAGSHVQGGGTMLKHRGNLSLMQDSFIGFQFSDAGKVHYGWARLSVSFHGAEAPIFTILHVHGYGYETTPNTAIGAGSCSAEQADAEVKDSSLDSRGASLGMLALGSGGVASRSK